MCRLWLLMTIFVSCLTHASVNDDLYKALSMQKAFSADFSQQVTDSKHKIIASSKGSVAFDRLTPGFLMHTTDPDESVIMYKKDGIYFYDAFLNQLTISPVQAFLNSPFALILISDKKELDDYSIKYKDGSYTLIPKKKNADIKSFSLRFDDNVLKQVQAHMTSDDISIYDFINIKDSVDVSALEYAFPDDAEIADDR